MTQFSFKEIDTEGMDTLSVIEEADRFNEWMYRTVAKHCKGKVLEIGSGIGNISTHFINDGFDITLSDIRSNYCDRLKQKFPSADVLLMDLVDPEFEQKWKHLFESFDSVFALNVVEHIKDDKLALENCNKLLKKGGKLVILVPAYQWLYNRFDHELEHYRRYNKKMLVSLFRSAEFKVLKSMYFNAAGIPGWYVSGKLQKNKTIPASQMKLYNALVPLFKLGDRLILNSFGLSVIAVGEK